jgi:hypothetical protein
MAGWMSVTVTHLKSAQHTLSSAHAAAGRHYDQAIGRAATIARRRIRAEMPRAKKSTTRLPPGRRPGALRKAVYITFTGRGWDASRKVHAGGMAHVLIPGAKAHQITARKVKALHLSSQQGADVRTVVPHPAIDGHPWVALGAAKAQPEIEALIAATGKTIVAELARGIEGR